MGNKKSAPRTYLSESDLILLENNTKWNRVQIVEWHSGFFKDCPNGKLDKKQFVKFYKQLLQSDYKADKYAEYVFSGGFFYIFRFLNSLIFLI